MYYQLHATCRLISGKSRGAIYDLKSGKVYSINESALKLLRSQEESRADISVSALPPAHINFFDALSQKGLGSFYITQPLYRKQKEEPLPPPRLNFVWLELTSNCNNRCLHCYTESSGNRNEETPISLEQYLDLIHEIRASGCTAIQFIGGEPLLYPHWRELVEKAADEHFTFIELFTNATLLDEESIDFLSRNKVHIATTIYADHAETHDKITQNSGSFQKTTDAIHSILQKKLPLRIASILMKANEHEAEKIMAYCSALGVESLPPDIVRPTGRGENQSLLPDDISSKMIQPPFYVTETEFRAAQTFHPCLAGKLAIAPNGDVFPCVFARNKRLGNILQTPLAKLLSSNQLRDCWHTLKDKIKKCRDCEYRYACPDCRPIAQNAADDHDWLAAPPDCAYDPYTGTWKTPTKND